MTNETAHHRAASHGHARFHHLAAKGFVLLLRYGDYQHVEGRGKFRHATDHDQELKEAARDRLEVLYQRRLPLRLLLARRISRAAWPSQAGQ